MLIRRRTDARPSLLDQIGNLPESIKYKGLINGLEFESNPRMSAYGLVYGDMLDGNAILKQCAIVGHDLASVIKPHAKYVGTELKAQYNEYTRENFYRLLFQYETKYGRSTTTPQLAVHVEHGGVIVFTVGSIGSKDCLKVIEPSVFRDHMDAFVHLN